jgi:LAS superfamily LD-carboxypeptidase LdcB
MTDVANRETGDMPKVPRTPSNSGAARKTPKKSVTSKLPEVGKSEVEKASTKDDPFAQNDLESVAEDQSVDNATNDGLEEASEDDNGTEVIPG